MNNLKKQQKMYCMMFASLKYWTDKNSLEKVFLDIEDKVKKNVNEVTFIRVTDEKDYKAKLPKEKDSLVLMIPMSGSVQQMMLEVSKAFKAVCVCPGYNNNIVSKEGINLMLENNTAPAAMDVFAMIKRSGVFTRMFTDFETLNEMYRAVRAVYRLNGSKLMLVGQTESWVISASRDNKKIKERFGIEIINKSLTQLDEIFKVVTDDEASEFYSKYMDNAIKIIEPTNEHILSATKLLVAVLKLVKLSDCDGFSIACFDLLSKLNTTSCISLSYLNDHEGYIGGCEGDLDSAITLMLMKAVSDKSGWMANPIIQPNDTIELSHCSAPTCMNNSCDSYILRNHHESSIGVSPQVNLQDESQVTLCRVGNEVSDLNAFTGTTQKGERLPVCRTQLNIKIDNMDSYLDNTLGCHLIMTYGDYTNELKYITRLLDMRYL